MAPDELCLLRQGLGVQGEGTASGAADPKPFPLVVATRTSIELPVIR